MRAERLSFPACLIAGKRDMNSHDLMLLRKYSLPRGIVDWADAHMLIVLNRECQTTCPEWKTYFVEQLAQFAVNGAAPRGLIDEAKGRWLQRLLGPSGRLQSPLEIEVILHAIEISQQTPESLVAFALDQIRHGLLPGSTSAYALLRGSDAPGVSVHDLRCLWRILNVAVEQGRFRLSPLERMVLVAIDNTADRARHHPAWSALIQAIRRQDQIEERSRAGSWLRTFDHHHAAPTAP